MVFKNEAENVPCLCFLNLLLVKSLQSGKAWEACTHKTEKSHSHTNSAVSRQVYVVYMPC